MISAAINEWKDKGMAATRTVTEGDETYEEILKRFSGIPANLVELVVAESKDRAAREGRRTNSGIKRGKIYGEILTRYMDAVEAGTVTPAVLSKAKRDKVSGVSVWIRSEIDERFTPFVNTLPNGNKSEVLSAALRWYYEQKP